MGKCVVHPMGEDDNVAREWIEFELYLNDGTMRISCIMPIVEVNGRGMAYGMLVRVTKKYTKLKATYYGPHGPRQFLINYIYRNAANAFSSAFLNADGVENNLNGEAPIGSFFLLSAEEQ